MCHLPRLPPELISDIVVHSLPVLDVEEPLQPRYDQLLRLCLVSHTWRALAQPHLFKHAEYNWRNGRLARLEKAVRGNEELAALAKRCEVVRLGTDKVAEFEGGGDKNGIEAVHSLHPRAKTLWVNWAASLRTSELIRFKELKHLHLGDSSRPWIHLDVPTPLPAVVRLSLTAATGRDVDRILNIPATTLPNLSKLFLRGQPFSTPAFATSPTPLSCAITSLTIETRAPDDPTSAFLLAFPAAHVILVWSGTDGSEMAIADSPSRR